MLLIPGSLVGQEWHFVKEKDGIFIYTRKEQGNSLKSFRGTADVRTTMDQVRNLIGNVENVEWWDKNVKEIKVLYFEKNRKSQYYIVYDSPWPVADRDLCVEAIITEDPVTGIRRVSSKPLLNVVPEKKEYVRIKDYRQTWTVEPTSRGVLHLTLEGYVDPAGSVPDWIYNMVITDTPYRVIKGIKDRLEK